MSEEIKPCPFCGKKAELFERDISDFPGEPEDEKWDIRCKTLDCYMEYGGDFYDTKEGITKRWNKRPDNWISIKERLPEEGTWVLAFSKTIEVLFFDGENKHGIHWLQDGDWDAPVTHWMPLPEPPTNQTQGT